ncbi:MAG: hypothetical protein FJ276_32285, partial [Planctomycetes bacterium]|nr:hypothetical protein [Planctomycetota bacterium]
MAGEGKAAASAESTAGRTAARACQAFERAWQSPNPPRAEQFLAGIAGPDRAALLFGLLKREITHRRLRGQTVTIAEYQARFPDEGLLVSALFPSVEHLRPLFVKCGY